MGFRARTADDVYRYAFRQEKHQDRSLGDGFEWTILLLGDNGEVTREFLVRYGVELSIATAHRVRFVFFSGLSQRESGDLAREVTFGRLSTRAFLDRMQRALGTSSWRHRPLDWEGDPWRELRPDAFIPFTDAHGVHQHITGHDKFWESAIPGTEASVRLAQTLGIGRHVPCLLLFTDLGAPQYHVLPFGDLTAGQVYRKARRWVDDYYEINRETLDHWSSVEERIHSLTRDARLRLDNVKRWPAERRQDWLALSELAECAAIARERPDAALQALRRLCEQPVAWRIGGDLSSLRHRLDDLEAREQRAGRLTGIARELQDASEPERIAGLLKALYRERPPRLTEGTNRTIKAAAVQWTQPKPMSPRQELFRWWRSLQNPVFSKRMFSRLRYALREFYASGIGEGESHADHIRRDYDAFWTALGGCALAADAERTADHVLDRLADHYGTAPSGSAWSTATQDLRAHVIRGVGRAQRDAPAWLLHLAPPLSLRECLYLGGRSDESCFRDFLDSSPRLAAAVHESHGTADRSARTPEEHSAWHVHHRDAVAQALLRDARRAETTPESRAALAREAGPRLELIRAEFQARVRHDLGKAFGKKSQLARLEEDLGLAERLGTALDDYDDAVRRLVLPHTKDRRVLALPTPSRLARSIGLQAVPEPARAAPALRHQVDGIQDDTRETLAHWEEARREGARWAPDARFADVLTAALPTSRAATVLAPFPGATPWDKAAWAVQDHRAAQLLGALSRQELALMLEGARPNGTPHPRLGPGDTVTPATVLAVFGLSVPTQPPESNGGAAPGPRVFISYAQEDDDGEHTERVRALWLLLRKQGVDAQLDLSAAEEPQDWALWMHEEFQAADHVLVVASPAYRRRAEGMEAPGTGEGVIWEARYIRNEVYGNPAGWHRRILKVVLPGGDRDDLPAYLGGHTVTHYTVDPIDATGVEKLLRYLTAQPYEVEPPVGPAPPLPPRATG
ncbi:toll/interleukin-1 receptor domain-containing protein [Streptomyces sp. W16]|uniref:toll/interleukin-1 receptor domain-containing protein n=1 Tax=Streptomyces sp. W16 TaxID=3076631 RepID=UPI00295B1D34|nr:toll/interleukin-1 receptor domain-containing protein [Streptomyces sp. W16]MDV9173854.1 toll/interleukin-1 receptor domain-containing protein [Streptomyces sp. W16]